jgi:hypothetical protein
MQTACTLKYLVSGVANAEAASTQIDVCEEIQGVLNHPGPVSARPLDGGLEVTISVTDIEPFSPEEFEPYVYEQVLWHSIFACCEMQGDKYEFKLLSSSFD